MFSFGTQKVAAKPTPKARGAKEAAKPKLP
jgi:hypothetical protein